MTITNALLFGVVAYLWVISTQIGKAVDELAQIKRIVGIPYQDEL